MGTIARLCLFLACLTVGNAQAQEACSALMKFGIYDQSDSISSSQGYQQIHDLLCNTNIDTYEKATKASGSVGFDLTNLLKLNGGGGSSDQEKQARYNQFCSSHFDTSDFSYNYVIHKTEISTALMKVMDDCVKATNLLGPLSYISASPTRTSFSFNARYITAGRDTAKINSVEVLPATVANSPACRRSIRSFLHKGNNQLDASWNTFSCEVMPEEDITVTLNVNQFGNNFNPTLTLQGLKRTTNNTYPQIAKAAEFRVESQVYVYGMGKWLHTGIMVHPGASLTIDSTDCVRIAGNNAGCVGPQGFGEGVPPEPACVTAGIKCGALYARIGDNNNTAFMPGTHWQNPVPATWDGELELTVGDINFDGNSGAWKTTVTIDNNRIDQGAMKVINARIPNRP